MPGSFAEFTLSRQSKILRGVYPERSEWAQNDSEGIRMTSAKDFDAICNKENRWVT